MFLHSWAIAIGLAGAALPFAVHWLTKPRPVRLPLSTLRFVHEAVAQRRAWNRLRDIIVLALRTAAVLLIAGALARPLFNSSRAEVGGENADAIRVVIVDISQSMAVEQHGIRAFERVRALASNYLEQQPNRLTNLILAGAAPFAVFQSPAANFSALREELAKAEPRPESLHVQPAINLAAENLAVGDEAASRELIVISDFQRTNWSAADFSPLPQDVQIRLESIAPTETPANLGILRVGSRHRLEVGREGKVEVDVGNFSATPRDVQVQVSLGSVEHRLRGNCPPNAVTTLSTKFLPSALGWQIGEAWMVDVSDALPADNRRPVAFEVHPAPSFAIISRQPEQQRPSSTYFLERALLASTRGQDVETGRIARIDSEKPDHELLGKTDIIVIDHPGRLPSETINALTALMRRGKGVLYVVSEPIDATNMGFISQAAGENLRLPVTYSPASGSTRRNLFLTELRRNESPFSIFGDEAFAAFEPLRFAGGLATHQVEGSLAEEQLAILSDRSALLVLVPSGAGAMAVMNCDLEASDLPKSQVFVPMLGELVHRLLGETMATRELAPGEPVALLLPANLGSDPGLKLATNVPDTDNLGELVPEALGTVWRAPAAGSPGVYEVRRGNATAFAIASGIPQAESDLRALPADVFEQRLSAGRRLQFRSASNSGKERQDWWWTWLAVACLGCVLGEVVVLKLFRT